MGRPCEYDEEKVLNRAMFVFWQKGYGGTSISDLEEAMQMKRQSIYNAFGDKSDLFGRSIARYRDLMADMLAPLRSCDASLRDLRAGMEQALAMTLEYDCGACMVVKTAFDQQVDDPAIKRVVHEASVQTRALYAEVIRKSQERGEVDSNADPASLSAYLFSFASGLAALAQTGGTSGDISRSLDIAFSALPPGPKRQQKPHRVRGPVH